MATDRFVTRRSFRGTLAAFGVALAGRQYVGSPAGGLGAAAAGVDVPEAGVKTGPVVDCHARLARRSRKDRRERGR